MLNLNDLRVELLQSVHSRKSANHNLQYINDLAAYVLQSVRE